MFNFFRQLFGNGSKAAVSRKETDMKRFLILCLGNMGPDYVGTRHNAGFMVGDTIAEEAGVPFKSCRYGDMAIVKVKNCELMLLKPSTFMNLSGVAARFWMNKENLPLENLLVIVDDISLPFGSIRIRQRGSDAGHNGLKNIAEQLGTQNYARLKFGVGNDFPKGAQVDFVLGKFPPEEQKLLPEKLKRAAEAVKAFCLSGPAFAMNHFNN
ncbi:MAG: aminoacyl-tRNA hydrolase [Bacteroides sp.]|nr:aminoacyl-tRNA hydrolase [Bacteroides sp.]